MMRRLHNRLLTMLLVALIALVSVCAYAQQQPRRHGHCDAPSVREESRVVIVQPDPDAARIVFMAHDLRFRGEGESQSADVGPYVEGLLFIDVSDAGEGMALDIVLQTSPDNAAWFDHTTIRITEPCRRRVPVDNFGSRVRVAYVLTGADASFGVTAVFK